MPPFRRYFFYRLLGAVIIAVTVLLGITIIIFALSGCRQMPVLRGQYQEDRVEQAKVDAKQSDAIASAFDIQFGQNGLLFQAAPEEVKPAVQQMGQKIGHEKAKADAQSAQNRERAHMAERDLQNTNSAPGAGAWLQAGLGALSGNFSGLLELLMGALGAGGAFQALRYRSRAQRMAEKAETYADMDPEVARKVVEVDEDLAKHRRKRKS